MERTQCSVCRTAEKLIGIDMNGAQTQTWKRMPGECSSTNCRSFDCNVHFGMLWKLRAFQEPLTAFYRGCFCEPLTNIL